MQETQDNTTTLGVGESYAGSGEWAALMPQVKEPVFSNTDKVRLSPSALATYFKCPRQFYYAHLLRLKQETSSQASLGTLVHSVMERFNLAFQQARIEAYTLDNLLAVMSAFFEGAEALFFSEVPLDGENQADLPSPNLPEGMQQFALKRSDVLPLKDLNRMERLELQQKMHQAFSDLARHGYFDQPVQSIRPEVSIVLNDGNPENPLGQVSIEGLERCELVAKLDALIQRENGAWDIVDYKFYGPNKFKQSDPKDGKITNALYHALSPFDEGADTHLKRFSATESKLRDPQLPFYYLLSQQDPSLAGQVASVNLQVIRPPFPDNPAQGAICVQLDPVRLEEALPQWVSDISRFVVTPIIEAEQFEAVNSAPICNACAFSGVCDGVNLSSADDGEGGEGA